jgi:hypothetical protein
MKKLIILGTLCLLFTISAVSQSKKEWERVQTLNSWNVYQQFLLNYPSGKYSDLARQKQALLKKPESVKKVETKKAEVPVEKNPISAQVGLPKNDGQILEKKGRAYFLNQQKISRSQLKDIYAPWPDVLKEYKLAKTCKTTGNFFTFGGLAYVLVSSQVVRMQRENDYTDWFNYHSSNHIPGTFDESKYPKKLLVNAGIGVGISAIGLICLISAPGHYTKAVNLYNSKRTTGFNNNQKLELGLTPDGIGITYKF